jgi:hypothetical protein
MPLMNQNKTYVSVPTHISVTELEGGIARGWYCVGHVEPPVIVTVMDK